MSGMFTGVGTGPGDPDLMTLKAVQVIRACSVIALPVSDPTLEKPVYEAAGLRKEEQGDAAGPDTGRYLAKCVAWQIAAGAVPEIGEKDRIWLPMPMIKDKEKLKAIHDRDAEALAELLDAGKDVAFLTLGDPTVYSTCMYVHKRLKRMGYETRIVPGIPSFCAAAARMDVPLAENRQEIHILPASYDIENSLELPGTKVLMKAGRKMSDVKRLLDEKGLDAMMVENCGMEEERIYLSTGEIPEEAGYYSLLVVKEKNERGGECCCPCWCASSTGRTPPPSSIRSR